jgi:hypothetical protein
LDLKRLGYNIPLVPSILSDRVSAKSVPKCADSRYFEPLQTARFGRIGWSSWDFAFEGWEGCSTEGFRSIDGHPVKCQHGPGCHYSKEPFRLSQLAEDASQSNVTLITTWFNDDQQGWSKYKCFNRTYIDRIGTAGLSIHSLLRTVRAIHARNPNVWAVVLAKYPQCYQHTSSKTFQRLNSLVKSALETEPRTLFVEYFMPPDYATPVPVYQDAHRGHPNCQGSKVMVHAILRRLYSAGVLGRSLALIERGEVNPFCSALKGPACHSSALCWVDPAGVCSPYGPGSKAFHTVQAVGTSPC